MQIPTKPEHLSRPNAATQHVEAEIGITKPENENYPAFGGALRLAAQQMEQHDEQKSRSYENGVNSSTAGVIPPLLEHVDVATVLKILQAVSGEIALEKLVEMLLRTAVEQAGAERALLILPRESELWIQAEAKSHGDFVTVQLSEIPVSAAELPESIVRYVARTQETVILDDASARNPYSTDEYIRKRHLRSVLCLPLVKQNILVALLYLENNIGSNIFAPAKITVMRVLASAAAISLDNSRLYRELQEREGRIRRLVDANIIGVLISDSEGQILESNDAFLKMLGYTREELVSGRMRWRDMTPPEWKIASERGVVQVETTGVCKVFEKEYFRKDGSRVPVLVGAARFEKNSIVAFAIDLTERKHAERALKQSEFYLTEAQRLAHMGSWAFNPAGFDYWSSELFRIHGLAPSCKAPTVEEYISLIHPEDRKFVTENIKKIIAEDLAFDFTKRIVRPDGEIRSVRCVGAPSLHGGISKGFVGTGMDVTEQERILDELKRSEFYLAEGQRLGHAGSWSFKSDGTCDYWSRELYQILGFDPNGGVPTISDYLTRVHPQDREVVVATIQRMIAAGEGCDLKKRIIRPNNVQRVIRCVGMPVRENGLVTRFVGTLMDITEQEELIQELRRREAYLAEAQRLSHTGSFGWKYGAMDELTWSKETYRICGFDPSIKPRHELVRDRVHPDDLPAWQQAFDRAAEGKEVDFKNRLVMPDGTVKFVHTVAYGVQKDGRFVELVGTVRDITEWKRADEAIRRSEAYLVDAQKLSQTGSWAWSPEAGITYWSEECYRVQGFDPQGGLPLFKELFQRVHPDDQLKWKEVMQRVVPEKLEFETDYRLVLPNGTVRDIHSTGHPILGPSGELIEYMGTVIDVTERKRAEEAIRRSEAFLAEGQRISHTGSWGWNASTGKLTWSQEHFRILGLDPQGPMPSLDIFWERVHPDDRTALQHIFEFAIKKKKDFEQEFRIVTPDYSIRHLHGVGHAILSKENELLEFIGSTMDITERKRAEERAQSQRGAIRLALNAFIEELDVNRFLCDVIAELNKQFRSKSWELWLFDEAINALLLHSTSHPVEHSDSESNDRNIRPLEELQGIWSIKDADRVPQILELSSQESLLSQRHGESLIRRGIKNLVIVPLALGKQNLGFLELHFQSQSQFSLDDLELAQALVNHLTLALQLNRLSRRAEQLAVTEERNRLAREIHDTLAQAFAGIVLHSEALGSSLEVSKQRYGKSLSQIQKLARTGLEEARRSVRALRPKALDGRTLSEALRQAARKLNDDAKLSCQFIQRGKLIHLTDEIQNELFRIGQEALTNVVKHAQAKSVYITLVFHARSVTMSIEDDGVGFIIGKANNQSRGFGMSTMHERANDIGALLRVESSLDRGTTIRVELSVSAKRIKK